MKKLIRYITPLVITFIIISFILISNVKTKAFNEDWVDYGIGDQNLYNKSNTYNGTIDPSTGLVGYDLQNRNSELVSSTAPLLTVLTPGLGSSAKAWSNNDNYFTYCEDSLINRLINLVDGGANVYWYRIDRFHNLEIIDINAQNNDIFNHNKYEYEYNDSDYYVKDLDNHFRITDISKPIIILFETYYSGQENDIVYRDFNYAVSKAVYDIRYLSNGVLPKINLIGHSRGGITNMQYALDHPALIDSMFSLGTPYLGSTSAEIDEHYNLGIGKCQGQKDITNPLIYLDYLNRWNTYYDLLYSNIKVYAIGGYSTLKFLLYLVENYSNELIDYIDVDDMINIIRKIDYIFLSHSLVHNFINSSIFNSLIEYQCTLILYSLFSATDNISLLMNGVFSEIYFSTGLNVNIFNSDLFVDIQSQIGAKKIDNITYTYNGFERYKKLFTESNCDMTKLAEENVPIAHNLETRDDELLSYIIGKIDIVDRTTQTYETYDLGNNNIGIKSIIKSVNDTTLVIPQTIDDKTVTEIGDYAFSNNFNYNDTILYVEIPSTVTRIGKYAFSNCSNLISVDYNNTTVLTTIDDYAFSGCTSLQSDYLPLSVVTIGDFVFEYCPLLTTYWTDSEIYYDIGDFNCASSEYENIFYINKGFEIYYEVNIECDFFYEFKVYANEPVHIKMYNIDMNTEIDQVVTIYGGNIAYITKELDKGHYFIIVYLENRDSSGPVTLRLDQHTSNEREITLNTEVDVLEHLHYNHNEFYFMRAESGFYKIILEPYGYNGTTVDSGTITVYSNNNIISKTSLIQNVYNNEACSLDEGTTITIYVESFVTYYIHIDLNEDDFYRVRLRVEQLNEYHLNQYDYSHKTNNLENGDDIRICHIDRTGVFFIEAIYNGNQEEDLFFVIFKKSNGVFSYIDSDLLNCYSNLYENELTLYAGDDIYIGYYNGRGNGSFNVNIDRYVSSYFNLITDPSTSVTIGTEVLRNNGALGGLNITQGYSRICYLGNNAPSQNTRLDYYWYSVFEDGAIVSDMGTVIATCLWEGSPTYKTVTIRAVYKYDKTKIANITFTVYKDTDANLNNPVILHKYGMDVRDNNLVGTEVSSGLGNIINVSYMPAVSIHTGYTRLITLGDDGLSQVIRHYDWSIDRKTGETGQGEVSSYGTIYAIVGGTLTIKGVYKYNPRYVIYITVEFI